MVGGSARGSKADDVTGSEKRLLTAIIVGVCLVALVVFGAPRFIKVLERGAFADLAAKSDKTYSEGDWVTLDSESDKEDVVTLPIIGGTVSYDVGLGFKGSVRFRVDSSSLYDDFEGTPIPTAAIAHANTVLFASSGTGEEFDLFLVKLTMENVDADTTEKTDEGSPLFLMTTLVSTDPLSECVYVSDYHIGGDAKGDAYISLTPGEKKSLTIGYAVKRGDLRGETVPLSGGFKNPNKYRVICHPVDLRPGVAS